MKRKAITAIIMTMFLSSILNIAFNTRPAHAYTWVGPKLVVPAYAESAGWDGWWFRHSTDWFMFNFTGINTALIDNWVIVTFYFHVTNAINGDGGLDGLVDVVVNPGLTPTTNYTDVLLDNIDPDNIVYAFGTGGDYTTFGQICIPKSHVIAGQLLIKLIRHTDSSAINDHATPGISANVTTPGVYEDDDAHTVHIYVGTVDAAGNPVSGGDIVKPQGTGSVAVTSDRVITPTVSSALSRCDLNEDNTVDIFDVVMIAKAFGTTWEEPPCPILQTQGSANILMAIIAVATIAVFGSGVSRLRKKL